VSDSSTLTLRVLTIVSEICFILVATFPYLAPGGYRALLIGPMIEGLLGGLSTITATINAYLSDVTPDGSRAAVFARLGGIMMLGFASGPVLGSLLIQGTGNM
jgi:MFS family permease